MNRPAVPVVLGRSVNPISTRGDRLCPPNYYSGTPVFLDLPTALCSKGNSNRKFQPSWGPSILSKYLLYRLY